MNKIVKLLTLWKWLKNNTWVDLWHGWGRHETPLVCMNGLAMVALFFISTASGYFTIVSLTVWVMVWVWIWIDCWICAGGTGSVGNRSGLAGSSPVPARLETDWMTGMGLDCWLAACLAACIPFHWDPAAGCPAVLLLWKLKQLTELKTKQEQKKLFSLCKH